MSNNPANKLIALVFDDPFKAEDAHAALRRMGSEGLLEMDESAILVKDADGKMHTVQDKDTVKSDQKVGHIAGLVAGAVTGTFPFILVGTLAGRLLGRLTDHGVTDKFIKEVSGKLQPGTSALLLYGRSDPERRDKVAAGLRAFSPQILEADMPPELEQELNNAMKGQ
jgi:uncharacterized membrane protein